MNNMAKKSRDIFPAAEIVDQPFGSMPRDCNSLRMMRFIQAASDSSPSCFLASSIAARRSLSKRNWKGWLPLRVLFWIDIIMTPNYYNLCVITCYIECNDKTTPRTGGTVPGRLTITLSEVTSWLVISLPKHALNLHGVFSPWVNSLIRSSVSQLPLSARRVQKRQQDVSAFWRAGSALRRYAMLNLQTLTAKARELRGNVVRATTTKGTRTMTPVYEREEQ